MKSNRLTIVIALLFGIGVLFFFFLSKKNLGGVTQEFSLLNFNIGASSSGAITIPKKSSSQKIFSDLSLRFSFAIPAGYHVKKILNDSNETILMQSKDSRHGFQVVITPFTDSGLSITKARIQSEAGLRVTNDIPVIVARVAQGLAFDDISSNPPLRDVWFVYKRHLYQVQTWKSDSSLLNDTLISWKFK